MLRAVIGAVAGAVFGLAMYKFVGCRTGACPLTGNPYVATILWAMVGIAVAMK
ncbi:MAG: YtxH domain-containing protein [Kiritimatiellae bacterium]|nr:YtxH domain-containing protein [Kiritimatiellia bacterium]